MKTKYYIVVMVSALLLMEYVDLHAEVGTKEQSHAKKIKKLSDCIFAQKGLIKDKLVIDFSGKITGMRMLTPPSIGFNPAFSLYNSSTYGDDKIDELFEKVMVKSLRFPGGTYANFFDWKEETLDEDAIESIGKKSMLNTVAKQKRRNKGKLIKASFDRYKYITDKYGVDKNITLNLYTRDVEYNMQLIDRIKNKNSRKINWELGNELLNSGYEKSYFSKFQWDHKIYHERAEIIAKYIKGKYPEDSVGIGGGELINERRIQGDAPEKIIKKILEWNKHIAMNKYIDAVIFHPYINLFHEVNWQEERVSEINCKTSNINIKKAALEFRWVLGQAQSIPEEYSRYAKNTIPNKKIWVTESGLLGEGRSTMLNWKRGIVRTLFNLTYYISWAAELENLDVYMFHLLGYGQGANHAIFLDGSLNSNTIAYKFVGTLLNGAENVFYKKYKTKNSLKALTTDKELSTVQIIGAETQNGLKVLLVNISPELMSIKLPDKNYCVRVIGGDPFSKITPGQYKNFQDITLHRLSSDYWDAPGFSASLIERCSLDHVQ